MYALTGVVVTRRLLKGASIVVCEVLVQASSAVTEVGGRVRAAGRDLRRGVM